MKRPILVFALLALTVPVTWSGVVIEMTVTDSQSGEPATDTIYVEGKMLRMDPHDSRGNKSSMIFRDDVLFMCEHDKKTCSTMDKATVTEMSAELGGAMKKMQEQLAQMPPEQRAMMEKMMQDRMPGGMGQEASPRRIEKGDTEQVGEYTCVVHTLYSGDRKVWEVCAGKQHKEAFEEAMEAFQAMSDLTTELREMAMQGPLSGIMENPFSDMQEIGGVPVRVRTYMRGELLSESTLRSVSQEDIDAAVFETPAGYKTKSLADEMKKGRRRR